MLLKGIGKDFPEQNNNKSLIENMQITASSIEKIFNDEAL
jgi:hypothetical protein